MNIDRMEFIAWMERIMERFDILKEYVLNIQKQRHSIDGEQLLDNQDVLQMLTYYTISGKLYYKLSDVHQFIRDSFNSPLRRTKENK